MEQNLRNARGRLRRLRFLLLAVAVAASLEAGVTTEDLGGSYSTSAVGDWIASKI